MFNKAIRINISMDIRVDKITNRIKYAYLTETVNAIHTYFQIPLEKTLALYMFYSEGTLLITSDYGIKPEISINNMLTVHNHIPRVFNKQQIRKQLVDAIDTLPIHLLIKEND